MSLEGFAQKQVLFEGMILCIIHENYKFFINIIS